MEAALERTKPSRPPSLDWTAPVSVIIVLLLAGLVLLPMYWLTVTSLRDDAAASPWSTTGASSAIPPS